MIYLDNSATTKPDPSILSSFMQVTENFFANPSSIHHLGVQAENLLGKAREQAASVLGVEQQEVVFTSGGTEGNNMAIKGIALEHHNRGKHIITTEIEHPSVSDACLSLEKLGFEITYLSVDADGVISIDELKSVIRDDTILISIMHVNNEIGSIQPIKEIGTIAKEHPKLFFHVDDVQGFGKVPLTLAKSGIDLCTLSGHKIHGLNGTGILYVNKRTTLFPLFHGGNQERAVRSGTENVAGAVAMSKAMRLIKENELGMQVDFQKIHDDLRQKLAQIKGVVINTPKISAPHIINISVPGLKPEVLIHMLAEREIYISTKSACSSKQNNDSKVLKACGFSEEITSSALRISMTYDNTAEELSLFINALEQSIKQLRTVLE